MHSKPHPIKFHKVKFEGAIQSLRAVQLFRAGHIGTSYVAGKLIACSAARTDKQTRLLLIFGILILIFSPHYPLVENSPEAPHSTPLQHESQNYISSVGLVAEENYSINSFIVAASSSLKAQLSPPQIQHLVLRRVWVPITAYSSTRDQTDSTPFITASGTRVRDGIVAANFLPIGTKVRMPSLYGNKVFVVEDRMNRRYWAHIDIWMPSRAQAVQFGLRTVPIEIIREI